jgi:hypothetical protein
VIRRLLPTVLVAEAPPASGLGPLGVLDCDSGLRLAQLDPANAADLRGKATEPARTRRCVERTLGLFERVNLLAEHPGKSRGKGDAWPADRAAAAWRELSPSLAGRRVCLVGRAADAAGLKGLPPLRWLRMGGLGEPAEVCRMPHPSEVCRWYNDPANRAAASGWLADERKRADSVTRAWCAVPGAGWVYNFARCEFGRQADGRITWGEVGDIDALLREVTRCAGGVRRFGGGGVDLLSHSLIVRSALPAGASAAARQLALVHDHHEVLVSDLSTPLKRIVGPEWREVEQLAARAVERLAGIEPTAADREAVRVADQIALRVEARALGIDLGDPADFGTAAAARAAERWGYVTLWQPYHIARIWHDQWATDGGTT